MITDNTRRRIGSAFRSSVLIARTIHEFRTSSSTNSWRRFTPKGKVGHTGTKHVRVCC